MGKYTRRGALGVVFIGFATYIANTTGFDSIESDRGATVNIGDDTDGLIQLIGFDTGLVPEEPHTISISNQTEPTIRTVELSADNQSLVFDQTGNSSLSITDNIPPTENANFTVSLAPSETSEVTDTLGLIFNSDQLGISLERALSIAPESIDTTVVSVPARKNASAEHTWTLENYTTPDVNTQIDPITLDYSTINYSQQAAFKNITRSDVTVKLTRQLNSGPDRSTIPITQSNSDFSGETALIDLSGNYETSVVDDPNGKPNMEVTVGQINNPPSEGTFKPEIKLDVSNDSVDTFSADLNIANAPFFDVSITTAPPEIFKGDTFDIDYKIINTGKRDTQNITLEVNGSQPETNDNLTLSSNEQFSGTFEINASNYNQSSPLDVVVNSEDSIDSRTITIIVPNEFSLTADPDTATATSSHTWEAPETDFDGEVDTITVEYPSGSEFDLDGLSETNVTVTMERELSDGPDTSEIDVNSGSYTGSEATFDLSGTYNTDLIGLLKIEINGVDNASSGKYSPTIKLNGDDTVTNTTNLQIS